MLSLKNPFFLLAFLFLLASCNRIDVDLDDPSDSSNNAEVEADLQAYFDRFENEGAKRGLDIDLAADGIIGKIEAIDQEHVAGLCMYSSDAPNEVTIDLDFWNSSSALWREFVVFHELGHCYLDRDHREDQHANGTCVSLMRSGLGDCFDNYNSNTREQYLNELFSFQ